MPARDCVKLKRWLGCAEKAAINPPLRGALRGLPSIEARGARTHGCALDIGDFGACRLGDRRPHHRLHHLARPAIPGPGRHDRTRPRLPRRSDPGFHRRCVQDLWRRDHQQRAEDAGDRRLYAMVSRMRALGMSKTTACADVVMRAIVDTYQHAEPDGRRSPRVHAERAGLRSLEGFQRSGAPGVARVRNAVRGWRSASCRAPQPTAIEAGIFAWRIDNLLPSRPGLDIIFQKS